MVITKSIVFKNYCKNLENFLLLSLFSFEEFCHLMTTVEAFLTWKLETKQSPKNTGVCSERRVLK